MVAQFPCGARQATRRGAAVALCLLVLCGGALEAAEAPVYGFDSRAGRFLEVFFPRRIQASGLTNGYVSREKPPSFADLGAVYEHNVWGTNLARDEATWVEFADVIDSYWLSAPREEGRLRSLLARAATPDVIDLVGGLARSGLGFRSVVEKALFQRDVWQAFSFCWQLTRLDLPEPEADFEEPPWSNSFILRGLRSLPIRSRVAAKGGGS